MIDLLSDIVSPVEASTLKSWLGGLLGLFFLCHDLLGRSKVTTKAVLIGRGNSHQGRKDNKHVHHRVWIMAQDSIQKYALVFEML